MATTHSQVHALAHAARMLVAQDARPDHPRAGEYAAQLEEYRAAWRRLTPVDRADTIASAEAIPDLTDARIAAAVATLEG